ncbi:hypothetical protein BJV85_002842 [Clostridium acetobutylicum]|uniref:Uncharacterized protein n=1 Tax=Clostridium acetobutylicum (strain ATCC 824 / DSM 792 / JCM 1419 / IAM 19013 / LMG 5710 / NBRC 13948 / NRRL B-527 / VKM B-1787 / 2291 / W) TaxID=272562 RepID=Q97JW6_CLOAB|nr:MULTISPECIES: hypothetical protein [Clostridium]AAK79129.1 Hypothetical protein CA_C1157 [Clostridium acetobutylicum ATCC 824]ADZ20207.1 Conserved hypothetical protein [Clostridium acetobutylicum EA 2018]AEI31665.1 hypothetical protein SMB_G1177 [Clostridium acetobutylicum DSM 1731]AWV81618.1 hypothetical protein DK921_16270 [Clostridium acetobutylicum]MBC2393261.1 hypothetical protein [Clostridium acetobutylicum]
MLQDIKKEKLEVEGYINKNFIVVNAAFKQGKISKDKKDSLLKKLRESLSRLSQLEDTMEIRKGLL